MAATDAVPQRKSDIRQTTSPAPFQTEPGRPHPLGATVDKEGVNFSVFSRNATTVELLLFERHDHVQPIQVIKLKPPNHQTFFFWHVYVKGLKPGAHYAYRVDGPQDLHGKGFRFNRNKVLVDPYALGNTKALFNRDDAVGPADNLATSMRSVVIDVHDYDWEGDQPLRPPTKDLIIYEMHVAGFTRHASSGVKHPGTFSGVIEKIPYLKELGITAVELLPVMQYDSKEALRMTPYGSGPLVEINDEKSRMVDLERGESFGFLGFDFRYLRSLRGAMRPHYTPKLKKRTALMRELKEVFRRHRSQPIERVISLINPMLRGWVNYFAVGHSSECFSFVKDWVEKKVSKLHSVSPCRMANTVVLLSSRFKPIARSTAAGLAVSFVQASSMGPADAWAYPVGQGCTYQISEAYSRMVLSLENLPELAMLAMTLRVHSSGLR